LSKARRTPVAKCRAALLFLSESRTEGDLIKTPVGRREKVGIFEEEH
jgi:hypothetical protein